MDSLDRASLLNGRRVRPVELPGVGLAHVKELTAAEVVEFVGRQKSDADGAVYFLLARGVCDASGDRLFADHEDEVKAIGHDAARALAKAIADVSGLNPAADGDEAKAAAAAKKNGESPPSATTPAVSSRSASA